MLYSYISHVRTEVWKAELKKQSTPVGLNSPKKMKNLSPVLPKLRLNLATACGGYRRIQDTESILHSQAVCQNVHEYQRWRAVQKREFCYSLMLCFLHHNLWHFMTLSCELCKGHRSGVSARDCSDALFPGVLCSKGLRLQRVMFTSSHFHLITMIWN